ncbi:MAG: phage holin family protein [Marmoricola sp.]|nr:phage holin family protein [Marmoricola sp.]
MAEREPAAEDPTIGKLVVDAFDDLGVLLRGIIELAKSELKVSFKAGGLGIVFFALAGFISLLAIIMASIAIALFIAMAGIEVAWSFLIVFGGYVLLAALLGLLGYLKVRKVRAPERTIAQAQEMPRALTGHDG